MVNVDWLFETGALKIAPSDAPFWYTSGLLGPYYINTEKLCGGEEGAKSVLEFIDANSKERSTFPDKIVNKVDEIYQSHEIFKGVVDLLVKKAMELLKTTNCSYISGGERRDWFFAPIVASKLGVPCLYIYNDKSVVDQSGEPVTSLSGNVMNIADLLTVGSSYVDKWAPAMEELGAKLVSSINVLDRSQGGAANLNSVGVMNCESLYTVDANLFNEALENKYIDESQHKVLTSYLEDQYESMRAWVKDNYSFIENALNSDNEKERGRAKKLVDENLYNLN